MLNDSYVLDYVKSNLGFPFNFIEIDDSKILDYIKKFTLKEFSHYFPDTAKVTENLDSPNYKVPQTSNEFYIFDPLNLEILNVVDVLMDASTLYLFGYPMIGPLSYNQLPAWTLQVDKTISLLSFSDYNLTFEFKHPNIVRICPAKIASGNVTFQYERMQSPDFSGIPTEMEVLFCQLALADMEIMIGRIRKKYGDGNIKTPFGDIPLGAEIYDEGKEMKDKIISQLETNLIPNVIMDIG